jgi:hypothetical protein
MKCFKKIPFYLAASALLLGMSLPAFAYEALRGPTGVLQWDKAKAYNGYTLFSPMIACKTTYLIDMQGNVVHKWKTRNSPGLHSELLPNGHLLIAGAVKPALVGIGGVGGEVVEYDWNGKVVWEYKMYDQDHVQHHTFHRMPNGNTLILGWERVSKAKAKALGRDPKTIPQKPVKYKGISHNDFWIDFVREVNKKGETVWEWHAIDHIGKGKDKLDINYTLPGPVGGLYPNFDWSHFNTVNYIPETDQIVLNSRNLSEFYLVNHKTGKIEYRWGNPAAYSAGKRPSWYDDGDQKVFGEHCATPLANGHILLFDNGSERPQGNRSAAVEVDPKTGKIVWQYHSKHGNSFFSYRQGAVQRLPNGNTLITSTHGGHFIEVTPAGEPVWEFVSPVLPKGKIKCVLTEEDAFPAKNHLNSMFNMVHRSYRYGPDYPGLKGKDLSKRTPLAAGCPQFFKVYKKGAAMKVKKAAKPKKPEAEGEEEGPKMHAY